jgi:hypothetical protein
MIAGKYNITAYLNRDYYQIFTFDINISAYTFIGAVDNNGSDVYFTIINIDNNNIGVSMDITTLNNFTAGSYNYDIKMNDGLNKQVIEGKFVIYNTVS